MSICQKIFGVKFFTLKIKCGVFFRYLITLIFKLNFIVIKSGDMMSEINNKNKGKDNFGGENHSNGNAGNNNDAAIKFLKMQEMLFDSNTKLPTLTYVLDEVKTLSYKQSVAIISVKINNSIVNLEEIYSHKKYDEFIKYVSELIIEMKGKILRNEDQLVVLFPKSDHFLIFLASPRNESRLSIASLEIIANRVKEKLITESKNRTIIPAEYIKFNIGYSIINDNPVYCLERALFSAIHEAEMAGIDRELQERQKSKDDLRQIINNEEIRTVFQPIVRISDFKIVAYEALARGPKMTKFEMPHILFSLAASYNFSDDLEWICILKSIINFNLNLNLYREIHSNTNNYSEDLKLFLNVDPKTLKDSNFTIKKFAGILNKYSIDPKRIVLEITERSAIEDFSQFKQIVDELKKVGFNIAIDDAGAGYSSLQAIAELHPKFLKFDLILVRDIDKDFIKQELLRTLLDFANKTNSIVIAEGIETEAEYNTIKALGAHLGQGYYFARPNPQFIDNVHV